MDASEDEEPLSDQHQENDGTTKTFASLISIIDPTKNNPLVTKLVKRLEDIPEISLPPTLRHRAALSLAKRGLVG